MNPNKLRAVVNVSVGKQYAANHARLMKALTEQGETLLSWTTLPAGVPSHKETPYGFKGFAVNSVVAALGGECSILWADSSIVPIRSLTPLWELIESQGYWFSVNLPYGNPDPASAWTTGHWTSDDALGLLGMSREDAFRVPHVIATAFGLDLRHSIARCFLDEYLRLAKDGRALRGPWTNEKGQASTDPRVLGHRHDQTVASVIAHRLGMQLTTPPAWIVDGLPPTPETILEIHR